MARSRKSKNKPDPAVKLAELANRLSLTAIRDHINELLDQAQAGALSYSDFLLSVLQLEVDTRESRRLTRNLKRSGFPAVVEGLDTFDFSVRPRLEARSASRMIASAPGTSTDIGFSRNMCFRASTIAAMWIGRK